MAAVSYRLYRGKQEDNAYNTLIKFLLNHERCDVNVFEDNNTQRSPYLPCTALHLAIASENKVAKQLLLDHPRIILNSRNDAHIACYYGDTDMTRMLMEREDFNINAKDSWGGVPLHAAAAGNHVEVAKLLLNHPDCVINAKDTLYRKAKDVAERYNSVDVAQLLILHTTTTLIRAFLEKDITRAEALLRDPGCDVNKIGDICVYEYTDIFNCKETTRLRGTPLMAAVSYRLYRDKQEDSAYNTLIQLLLNHERCDVNVFEDNNTWRSPYLPCTALHFAIASENKIAKQLLFDHPRIILNSRNDAHSACHYGDTDMTRMLMKREDFNINATDSKGGVPLHAAAARNHVEVAQLLLQHPHCDINAKDRKGWVPLLAAAERNHVEVAQLLLQHPQCDINATDSKGGVPLHAAAARNHVEVAQLLLQHPQCDINAKDSEGRVPLHAAAARNHVEVAQLLLNHPDCVINVKDSNFKTAKDVAVSYNSADVAQLLILHTTTPLIRAILEKDITRAEALLRDPGYDVNKIGDICVYEYTDRYNHKMTTILRGTPLMAAVSYRLYRDKQEDGAYNTFIKLLLNHERCDVNVFKDNNTDESLYLPCTALHLAIASENKIAKQLLLHHQRIILNSRNDTHIACYHGDTDMTRMLMEREDFNINATDSKGGVPLHVAAAGNHVEVAQLLLQHFQCDINAKDRKGKGTTARSRSGESRGSGATVVTTSSL